MNSARLQLQLSVRHHVLPVPHPFIMGNSQSSAQQDEKVFTPDTSLHVCPLEPLPTSPVSYPVVLRRCRQPARGPQSLSGNPS